MSVTAAFNNLVPCEILVNRKNRPVNAAGIFTSVSEDQNICTGYVTPKELDELKLVEENSVMLELLNVYFVGDTEIDVNDEITIEEKNYSVRSKRFRPEGNFTKTIVRRLERKNVTA